MQAGPGEHGYGILSISVRTRAEVSMVADVPARDFTPIPKVDSRVLCFERKKEQFFADDRDEKMFFKTVKMAFSQRRKTLLNSMSAACAVDKVRMKNLLEKAEMDSSLRAETITPEQYLRLSRDMFPPDQKQAV